MKYLLIIVFVFLMFNACYCEECGDIKPKYFRLQKKTISGLKVKYLIIEYQGSFVSVKLYNQYLGKFAPKIERNERVDRLSYSFLRKLINILNFTDFLNLDENDFRTGNPQFRDEYTLIMEYSGRKVRKMITDETWMAISEMKKSHFNLYLFQNYLDNETIYRKNGVINYWR